jgi:superfamily I DNA/RNA helicase
MKLYVLRLKHKQVAVPRSGNDRTWLRIAVVLLTVRRSKGLEFDTVFFLGMDDDQWWAYDRDMDDRS